MQVQVHQRIAARADAVFGIVGDFTQAARWTGVAACTVEGRGIGARRTVTFTDPARGRVVERLVALDPERRTLSWRLDHAEPAWPVRDYVATVRVVPVLADVCRLEWGGRFEPGNQPELAIRAWLEELYQAMIDDVRRAVGDCVPPRPGRRP